MSTLLNSTISLDTQPHHFMNADVSSDQAEWVLVGIPYDGTCSYRPGTRFGPSAIREASWGLETYCPAMGRDLEWVSYADLGDLALPFGNRSSVLSAIEMSTQQVLKARKHWAGLGGEHLITLPVIKAYLEHYPDLAIVHFDAHADLRADYLGEPLSHATVMRRIVEMITPERLMQIGIRSGPQQEFEWMKHNQTLVYTPEAFDARLAQWGSRPIFLTIDLDVLDPSVLPGTGTPEPGGMTYNELQQWLKRLTDKPVVGFDVVELSPPYDASGVSNVVAAKVVRQCLLLTAQIPQNL